jgi:hypothetical protein
MAFLTATRRTTSTWLAWVLVALIPHVLVTLGLGFAGMMSMYVAWPTAMGPFALAHAWLLTGQIGLIGPLGWLSALAWSSLWFAALAWLWRRGAERVVLILGSLSLVATAWALWAWILPPT